MVRFGHEKNGPELGCAGTFSHTKLRGLIVNWVVSNRWSNLNEFFHRLQFGSVNCCIQVGKTVKHRINCGLEGTYLMFLRRVVTPRCCAERHADCFSCDQLQVCLQVTVVWIVIDSLTMEFAVMVVGIERVWRSLFICASSVTAGTAKTAYCAAT